MALKVLPNDVRSILCASTQINNYKTAVEELVYNSLDAESTSIAIRIHIQENRIQVIDNGCGIAKIDYEVLGQRYMTSKYADTSTLKTIPKYYGYRGELLANIIEISRNVKIISRYKDNEETWAKTFHEGKHKSITKMTTRPSKGTTVEIRGFLYNLHIKNIAIDPINDLQNIKSFLEQLSLVHDDISLSLRDDSKNDIMFKVHKKRDIYQTLNILFNIERSTVQELQVEKNEYKVKAFIGKTDLEIGKHWIYLNGRYIQNNSKIHEVINEYLKKYLLINDKKKSKSKHNHDEYHLFKQKIPFYFLFIACPYMDYDIGNSTKHLIEFKNWEQIKKILEKLVKFYIGDVRLKEINKIGHTVVVPQEHNENNENPQDKIKNIISKILGKSKRLGVSELRNGVKGKLIKRKKKKRRTPENVTTKNVSRQQEIHINSRNEQRFIHSDSLRKYKDDPIIENITNNYLPQNKVTPPNFDKNTKTNYVKTSKTMKNTSKKQKKIKEMSPVKGHINLTTNKTIIKPTETNKTKGRDYYLSAIKYLTETDSVQLKSRIVAQEAEDFFRRQNNYNIIRKKCTGKRKNEENVFARNTNLTNNMRYNVDSKVRYKFKANPFKTTYDLVQTVFESQKEGELNPRNNSSYNDIKYYPVQENLQASKFTNETKRPWNPRFQINEILSNYTNIESGLGQNFNYDFMSKDQSFYQLTYENNSSRKYTELKYRYDNINNNTDNESKQRSLRCEDLSQENSDILHTQHETSRHFSYTPTASLLTYESHQYGRKLLESKNHRNVDKSYRAHSIRFISKKSRDNFLTTKNNYSHTTKYISKPTHIKEINKRICNKSFITHVVNESCTIEFTKSSEMNCSVLISEQSNFAYTTDYTQHTYHTHTPSYEPTSGFGNTYTIPIYSISADCNSSCNQNQSKYSKVNEFSDTYSVVYTNAEEQKWQASAISSENKNNREFIESNEPFATYSVLYTNAEVKNREPSPTITKDNNNREEEVNIVFVSKQQNSDAEMILVEDIEDIEPMNICETVLSAENESIINEFALSFDLNRKLNDSLYNNSDKINHDVNFNAKYKTQIITAQKNEDISHHFSNTLTTRDLNLIDTMQGNTQERDNLNVKTVEKNIGSNNVPHNVKDNNFSFKDRLRFLPKGMSQIFENCGSKNVCDYNLDQDYYEDAIYNEFANNVQMQTEVYEPAIQNVEDLATKDIQKFKSRVRNDNTSLVFDEKSIKSAKILNQVDCKFIATLMKEKTRNSVNTSEYLVLFDQHAVHERIKLEQNLLDYIKKDTWKSVVLDNNITLKTNQDLILYLHNYKDKFVQLGLQWTIMNKDEVSISSIPEAILGKNPREVDKIIKAVKSLIVEEINVIKLQKGNISLYPKSIMDLVFSEACRYAIKFGDVLSKSDCVKLLKDLSNCKTPFQCAHGRPVMAVLVDYKSDINSDYKINMDNLLRFKLNNKLLNTK